MMRHSKPNGEDLTSPSAMSAAAAAREQQMQRELAERLLLSALRAQDDADSAEASRRTANFLLTEGRRLGESLDEEATWEAISHMALPRVGTWCLIDMLGADGQMTRRRVRHPISHMQTYIDSIGAGWKPVAGDRFGLPAIASQADPQPVFASLSSTESAASARSVLGILRELAVGDMYTVPLIARGQLAGAVTFVDQRNGRGLTAEDQTLAADLASRAAMALDRARLYGEALTLRSHADLANQAKSTFLGMMSHELRTPLNAIGGYVDLLDLEVHGPINDAQREDLARIRSNQRYLTGLISDVLNLAKSGSGAQVYAEESVTVREVVAASISLVQPLFGQRHLTLEPWNCDETVNAIAERERVLQILVNLLSNAIKFTNAGGSIAMKCNQDDETVSITVSDTGIGIAPEKLAVIFEPFVQVRASLTGLESGVGLGLAISCNLAHAMHGDLTVQSELGHGSRFTLTLPRARNASVPQ